MPDIKIKTEAEIRAMKDLGRILADIFKEIERVVREGISTIVIEKKVQECIERFGVKSALKGYRGYPACTCVSVNEEVVHGIPREDKVLKNEDIVGVDIGIYKDGFFMDAAYTYTVGSVPLKIERLLSTTKRALYSGIDKFKANNRLGDISHAIEETVMQEGFSVVKNFVGHGIGRELHEEPAIPNFGKPHQGDILREGMVFAIEPMVNEGCDGVEILPDGWTAVTADRMMSAHFEHTVALTYNGPLILTQN